MGDGSALAEVQFGTEIIEESATIDIFRALEEDGHLTVLLYALAYTPLVTEIALPGQLLPTAVANTESLHIAVPLVPTVPYGPDVSITRLHARFGPPDLTYYEHTHGQLVPYTPKGILLPNRCPHGGFAFSAALAFLDGSHTRTRAIVPCPAGVSD